ncbi:MAG: hypothetical protein JW795_12400 [Chitinivibrionales bacterium]|nr:hypothetical protein [Chitinivibrionales bacterium]
MIQTLAGAGYLVASAKKYTEVIVKEFNNGILIFLQQGARLIGLYPHGDEFNCLWTNPQFEDAVRMMRPVLGGNRLWLTPERKFFYENPRDFEGFHIPYEIDPGEYRYVEDSHSVIFNNDFSLMECDSNRLYDHSITERQFTPLEDPYESQLSYVGVSIVDTIIIPDDTIQVALSSKTRLVCPQTDSGRSVYIPCQKNGSYKPYGEALFHDDSATSSCYFQFKIDDESQTSRIALRPEDIVAENPVKFIYACPVSEKERQWFCVVKRSTDVASSQANCAEVPRQAPQGSKEVCSAHYCRTNEEHSPFCELSLHFRMAAFNGTCTFGRVSHQILAYIAPIDEMLELIKTILQVPHAPPLE